MRTVPFTVQILTGTAPAAGAEISYELLDAWVIYGFAFDLTTDATVANRRVSVYLDDGSAGAVPLFWGVANINQPASVTWRFFGGTAIQSYAPRAVIALPLPIVVPGPYPATLRWRIRTATEALQAGDQFGALSVIVAREAGSEAVS